ncbi:MAG: hypothetical protein ACT4PP_02020 [Sporichthyaceae bacterium]
MSGGSATFPPVVYAPTQLARDDGLSRLELIKLADGRVALFVYSAMDRLADFYRADAPWILLTVARSRTCPP